MLGRLRQVFRWLAAQKGQLWRLFEILYRDVRKNKIVFLCRVDYKRLCFFALIVVPCVDYYPVFF